MAKYLLDTNAYFALLKSIAQEEQNDVVDEILKGDLYISKLTEIEIVSVIGKYSRGCSASTPICERVHADTETKCGNRYIIKKQKKWSQAKLKMWLKLEKEISSGRNSKISITVLDVDSDVISEAKGFIQNALTCNFGSMDAMILGTAKANSTTEEEMIVVTADKGLTAGMKKASCPCMRITY